MMTTYIMTRSQTQATSWLSIFGVDRLPIHDGRVDDQVTSQGHDVATYWVKMSDLSMNQKTRLAGHTSRKLSQPYNDVLSQVMNAGDWPVDGRFCYVIDDESHPIPTAV